MKRVSVHWPAPQSGTTEGFLLENQDDAVLYSEEIKRAGILLAQIYVGSGLPTDKFDHLNLPGVAGAVHKFVSAKWMLYGGSLIVLIDDVVKELIVRLSRRIRTGPHFVNYRNGMTPAHVFDKIEVLEENVETATGPDVAGLSLVAGSRVLNLENDPILEKYATKYMHDRWGKFSHIVNMRYHGSKVRSFIDSFVKFNIYAESELTVYVYTTGSDVDQIMQYSMWCVGAGITRFLFHFNSGFNQDLREVMDTIRDTGAHVDVELITELNQ